jgi:hypothetical protein
VNSDFIEDLVDKVPEEVTIPEHVERFTDLSQITEIPQEGKFAFKSELFFQSEQLLRIVTSELKQAGRVLDLACFDFI